MGHKKENLRGVARLTLRSAGCGVKLTSALAWIRISYPTFSHSPRAPKRTATRSVKHTSLWQEAIHC